jgi:hypothetical protein
MAPRQQLDPRRQSCLAAEEITDEVRELRVLAQWFITYDGDRD